MSEQTMGEALHLIESWALQMGDWGWRLIDEDVDPFAWIAITSKPATVVADADFLVHQLRYMGIEATAINDQVAPGDVWIQAGYDPADKSAVVEVYGLDDAVIRAARHRRLYGVAS